MRSRRLRHYWVSASVNTIKATVHAGRIQARKVGTHDPIPLTEMERRRDGAAIRGPQCRAACAPTS